MSHQRFLAQEFRPAPALVGKLLHHHLVRWGADEDKKNGKNLFSGIPVLIEGRADKKEGAKSFSSERKRNSGGSPWEAPWFFFQPITSVRICPGWCRAFLLSGPWMSLSSTMAPPTARGSLRRSFAQASLAFRSFTGA